VRCVSLFRAKNKGLRLCLEENNLVNNILLLSSIIVSEETSDETKGRLVGEYYDNSVT
jgi:hypothetical protein